MENQKIYSSLLSRCCRVERYRFGESFFIRPVSPQTLINDLPIFSNCISSLTVIKNLVYPIRIMNDETVHISLFLKSTIKDTIIQQLDVHTFAKNKSQQFLYEISTLQLCSTAPILHSSLFIQR